jgi:methanogenic corrinoid protein MtbC1
MTSTVVGLDDAERDAYWRAISTGDDRSAIALADEASSRGVPVPELLDLVVGSQLRVGRLWADNEWTVAQEHAATAVGEAVVRRMGGTLPDPPSGPRLVMACVEREWHALPAMVVALQLRGHGFRVDYLGANASRDHLVSHIVDRGPRAVLLSASLSSSLPRVRRQVEAVRGTGTPVVVGGRAFDAAGLRARRLGATAYAADAEQLAALLVDLPRHVSQALPLRHPAAVEARALQGSVDEVVRDVGASLRVRLELPPGSLDAAPDDWRVVLSTFVPHVVDGLVGALLTEDASILTETRDWLTEVLAGRGARSEAVEVLWQALRLRLHDHPEALGLLDAADRQG